MPSTEAKYRALACAFSLLCGYSDVITFTRWRGFGTLMTGNLILCGRSLIAQDFASAAYYSLVILAFFLGAFAYRAVELRWPGRGARVLGFPLATLLVAVEVVDVADITREQPPSVKRWFLVALAPMFGMLLTACTTGGLGAPTTMITGHVATLGQGLANRCANGSLTAAERGKVILSCFVLTFTFLGAVVAALVLREWDRESADTTGLLLPVAPCMAVLVWCYDRVAKGVKQCAPQCQKDSADLASEDSSSSTDAPLPESQGVEESVDASSSGSGRPHQEV